MDMKKRSGVHSQSDFMAECISISEDMRPNIDTVASSRPHRSNWCRYPRYPPLDESDLSQTADWGVRKGMPPRLEVNLAVVIREQPSIRYLNDDLVSYRFGE